MIPGLSFAPIVVVAVCLTASAALPPRARIHLIRRFVGLAVSRGSLVVVLAAVLLVAIRLCCLPIAPVPTPLIPDEHSHILLAQTLADGRVTTPAHPMWRHFETLFVLQQPSYASVYPPFQGLLLASGLVLFGHLWAGVLASIAAMFIAFVWMLRGYLHRGWALYGGLLAGVVYGLLSYWGNSYWGGAGPAIGGALVFGALPRIVQKSRLRDAAVLGAGLLILANSRPFEGFLVALPVVFWAALHFASRRSVRERVLRMQAGVLVSVLTAGAGWVLYYNWRITGEPFELPYQAYIQQYAAGPAFVWQTHPPPHSYGDRVLRDAHISLALDDLAYSTYNSAARRTYEKLSAIVTFYWGPFWPLVLLVFPDLIRERRFRIALLSLGLCMVGILLTVGFQIHYAAPCASIFVLLLIETFRRVYRRWRTPGAVLLVASIPAWAGFRLLSIENQAKPNSLQYRPAVQARIAATPGQHLVFVQYSQSHRLGEEWVYNEPDIDASKVVWARDLGQQSNADLMRYYSTRTFWIVEPDFPTPRVIRSPSGLTSHPML